MAAQILDIYDIIIKYAKDYKKFLTKEERNKVDLELLGPADVNLENLKMDSRPAKHDNRQDPAAGPPIPKNHVLFTSSFNNNTERDQTYSLRTERRTTAVRRVQLTRGLSKGSNFTFQLSAPNSVVAANAAFKDEVRCERTGESVTTEDLVWSLNSEVSYKMAELCLHKMAV